MINTLVANVTTTFLSFKNDDSTKFIGVKNYDWAFTTSAIQHVLLNTLLWIIIAPVLTTAQRRCP